MANLKALDDEPKVWTSAGEPMTPERFGAILAGFRERHGPDGLSGWAPEPDPIIGHRCRNDRHEECRGEVIGPHGYSPCGCDCHP